LLVTDYNIRGLSSISFFVCLFVGNHRGRVQDGIELNISYMYLEYFNGFIYAPSVD